MRKFLPFLCLAILSVLPSLAWGAQTERSQDWVPSFGDVFVVDVGSNAGYLVHSTGERTEFPVATGRREMVRYIGRSYNAATPVRSWTAEQFQTKGDRRTFGVSGRFLRLFRDGENSPYGIHSYYKVADWMQEDERYFSMGCIVVTEEMMDVLVETFRINNKKLTVISTNDAQTAIQQLISASTEERKS